MFRDTGLDDTRQAEFSKRFGDLHDIKPYLTNGRKAKFLYYELFEAGNLDDEGKPIALDSQRSHYNKVREPSSSLHFSLTWNHREAAYGTLIRVSILVEPRTPFS